MPDIQFRIAAPFVHSREIALLKKAGADELFCGFVDEESERFWPIYYQTMNRRFKGASIEGFSAFQEAAQEAGRMDIPLYVTMNWHYTPEQYPWLLKTIRSLSRLQAVQGLIVADMGLLLTLKKIGYEKEIHISTGGTVFNSLSADFFHSLGAQRVILDRQMTPEELRAIFLRKKTGIGIEIFIFNTACLFIDGFCMFIHWGHKKRPGNAERGPAVVAGDKFAHTPGCKMLKAMQEAGDFRVYSTYSRPAGGNLKYAPEKYPLGCNLCGLYVLKEFTGITLKVLDREARNTQPVRIVRQAVAYLGVDGISQSEYIRKVKALYASVTGNKCTPFSCYCPEPLMH